jgi:hypothetical protein
MWGKRGRFLVSGLDKSAILELWLKKKYLKPHCLGSLFCARAIALTCSNLSFGLIGGFCAFVMALRHGRA